MEELIDSFALSEVTPQKNSTARDHPLFSLYKAKNKTTSQEERRRKFLEAQKSYLKYFLILLFSIYIFLMVVN